MRVGVPREIKNHEYRVAITPAGVHELTVHGHEVFIEREAGLGSSITDAEYVAAGATSLDSADAVWETGELILKVKEPIEAEYHRTAPVREQVQEQQRVEAMSPEDFMLEQVMQGEGVQAARRPRGERGALRR